MGNISSSEINDALAIVNRLLPLVDEAERKFKSARNWGILDVLGGGFIIDMIKHYKIDSASSLMNEINYLTKELSAKLKTQEFSTDYTINKGTFATIADFAFDNLLTDLYMQSKISGSLNMIRDLKFKLLSLRQTLLDMRNR